MKHVAITLLELLIVIIILGVLALVAIPNYRGLPAAALHAHAQNSMAYIAHAAKIWSAEFGTQATPYPGPVSHGSFEAKLGTAVTGIDLQAIDAEKIWHYALSNDLITATFQSSASSVCAKGSSFSYNLTTDSFTAFKCR